jgi:hypothetical protein
MLRECDKTATKLSQDCYKSVTRVSRECYKSATNQKHEITRESGHRGEIAGLLWIIRVSRVSTVGRVSRTFEICRITRVSKVSRASRAVKLNRLSRALKVVRPVPSWRRCRGVTGVLQGAYSGEASARPEIGKQFLFKKLAGIVPHCDGGGDVAP